MPCNKIDGKNNNKRSRIYKCHNGCHNVIYIIFTILKTSSYCCPQCLSVRPSVCQN